jgi:hypothetical protein
MNRPSSSDKLAIIKAPLSQARAAIVSILLLYITLTFFCWGRVTDIIIDRGFEIYLAWRMNQGEMPISDYYLLVPPASYQINALLFRIFGENLSVLLSAGILNGFVFVLLLFAVLSRVTTVLSAWSIAISAILVTIFSDSIFNFILPYTFAMPYASSAFMGSLLALLAFVDGGKRSRLLWSGFLYGLSVCLKYEFVLFGAVVFITPFATRFKLRYWLIQTLLCAAAPMILSLVLLTTEGSASTIGRDLSSGLGALLAHRF